MNFTDMLLLGFENLARTRLRTFLTLLGVIVGIGALSSMMSFGTGMQKNITDAFYANDLFTSMTVTSRQVNMDAVMSGDMGAVAGLMQEKEVPLTDSSVAAISAMPGVAIAIPEITFPVRLRFRGHEHSTSVQVLPPGISRFKPYDNIVAGRFFDSDTSTQVVIREEELRRLNIVLEKEGNRYVASAEDSVNGVRELPADSILGYPIDLVTVVFDLSRMRVNPIAPVLPMNERPLSERVTRLGVGGVLGREGQFGFSQMRGSIILAPGTAEKIPRLGFTSVWDVLSPGRDEHSYSSVYVRVEKIEEMEQVRKTVEEMGYGVVSLADRLDEFRRSFVIINSLLGAVGFVALFVAALGIINTMLMSILERTREIGIMKAIGGSEKEIRWIFFTEAGTIGMAGGILGLVLGWLVTRVANLIINAQLVPLDQDPVDMFYFPAWLLAGSLTFSILVSLAAGLYPAARAARIDPVKALRHD